MRGGGFADVLMLIVWLAIIATLVAHANTARIITAAGNAFSNSIAQASKGQADVPHVNPFIESFTSDAAPVVQQAVLPGRLAGPSTGAAAVNPYQGDSSATGNQTNAAGTSENVALHVALIVAVALVGVYVLRQTGFKFVVAGSVGT